MESNPDYLLKSFLLYQFDKFSSILYFRSPTINIIFSGGAVAVDLASRLENSTKIRCLMVENTFTSIPEVAKSLFNTFLSKNKKFRIVIWTKRFSRL